MRRLLMEQFAMCGQTALQRKHVRKAMLNQHTSRKIAARVMNTRKYQQMKYNGQQNQNHDWDSKQRDSLC